MEIILEALWGAGIYKVLGLATTEKTCPTAACPGGLVPASQWQNPAVAHSCLVYFSSLSIHTECLKLFSVLVPQDIRDIHPHMHCQTCHMSSTMLLRPHEILLLSNNGLRASLRPHYTLQIISK